MKISDLLKALAVLDPELDINATVFLKEPGNSPPRVIIGGKSKDKKPIPVALGGLTLTQRAEVRTLASEMTFFQIARKFGLHRATVSRYIHKEVEAGRMGKVGLGYVPIKGAYDLQTFEPVKSSIDT